MNLSPVLKQRFFDANGLPLAGGSLYSYAAGTSTPQATYSNATGTTNTNPVVLDASGYADVWLDPTLAYKFVLKDSGGATIFTEDGVTSTALGVGVWGANTVYSQGAIVQDSSGQGLLYVSLTSNNQGNALTSVSNWRVFAGNVRTVSSDQTSPTLLVTDDLVRSNSTSGNRTHTLPPCATTPIGKRITVKDVGTSTNTTSLKGSGTDTVDGANTYSSTLAQYASVTVENNGTSWDVITLGDNSVTTPKIAANAVTDAKIQSGGLGSASIATGAVTQDKLAARATGTTVAAGGVAVSASSGALTISNDVGSGLAAVTGLSVTITTTGRPVAVLLVPDTSGNYAFLGAGGGTAAALYVAMDRDGTIVGATQLIRGTDAANFPQWGPGSISAIDLPAAGAHTYKIKAARGVSNAFIFYCRILAYEL